MHHLKYSNFLLWGPYPVATGGIERPLDTSTGTDEPGDHDPFFYGCRKCIISPDEGLQNAPLVGVPGPLMQWMVGHLNRSQRGAIRSAAVAVDRVMHGMELMLSEQAEKKAKEVSFDDCSGLPFTLIQGPPGTGKTTTILALLNIIHVKEYAVYFEHAVARFLGDEGICCRQRHLRQQLTATW